MLASIGGNGDRSSQLAVLRAIHGWCEDSVQAIKAVYGDTLAVELTPLPGPDASCPAWAVSLEGREGLLAWLEPQGEAAGKWTVLVALKSADRGEGWLPLARPRGKRTWTRTGIEDALLGLVGMVERRRLETLRQDVPLEQAPRVLELATPSQRIRRRAKARSPEGCG